MNAITLGVISGALESIITEMAVVVRRTARSPVLAIGNDFSNAIFDGVPRLAAQGAQQPVHVGGMMGALEAVKLKYGGDLRPGDIIYHNDPVTRGSHLPDMTVYKPIWFGEEIAFWAGCRAHMDETGGPVPGGYNPHAEEIYGEGLRIPPIKLVEHGKLRTDLVDLILANLRTPEVRRGDLGAQMSAVNIAERRLVGLLERYGKTTVDGAIAELLERADGMVRREVATMPDGVYCGNSIVEDDGHGSGDMEIRAHVSITDAEIGVRLESPPQVKSYLNSYESNSRSAVFYALVPFFSPTIPHNDGTYRSIAIDLGPPGTLLNASEPAACGMSTGTPFGNIVEAIRGALAELIPERAAAGWSDPNGCVFSGIDPRSGQHYSYLSHLTHNGGGGASYGVDGRHCVGALAAGGASMTGDIELIEVRLPLLVRRYELLADSACPGRWRGGLAPDLEVEILDHECLLTVIGDGMKFPPPSVLGAGSPHDQTRVFRRWIVRQDGTREDLQPHSTSVLEPGDRLGSQLPGGGGVEKNWLRPITEVWADVRNGFVSLERAREEYGVIIEEQTLKIDHASTAVLRESMAVQDALPSTEAH